MCDVALWLGTFRCLGGYTKLKFMTELKECEGTISCGVGCFRLNRQRWTAGRRQEVEVEEGRKK